MCPAVFGIQLDGLAVAGNRLVQLPLCLLDDAKVVAGHCRFRTCRQGRTESAGLFRMIAAGKSKLKAQPEVARMLDQSAAVKTGGIAPGGVEAMPECRQ